MQEFFGATTPGADSYNNNYSGEVTDEAQTDADYEDQEGGEEEYEEYHEGNSAGVGAVASAI